MSAFASPAHALKADRPPPSLKPQLIGTCRAQNCPVQHLHPATGAPPDYHWTVAGVREPRWVEPKFRQRNKNPDYWYYRLGEIAELCGVGWITVRNWIRHHGLKCTVAPGGRVMLVQARDLDRFLRSTNRAYPRKAKK